MTLKTGVMTAENLVLHHINYVLKCIKIENHYLKLKKKILCSITVFFCIFDQINGAFVSISGAPRKF